MNQREKKALGMMLDSLCRIVGASNSFDRKAAYETFQREQALFEADKVYWATHKEHDIRKDFPSREIRDYFVRSTGEPDFWEVGEE